MTSKHRSGYWQDLTTTDFRDIDPEITVALLPVSAVEQHGPHLPLSTDAVINEGIVHETLARVGEDLRLLVLPPVTIGHSVEHTGFPGTLSTDAETLLALWTGIGRSAARAGVRKLILLNTHGGQRALVDLTAVRLRVELGMLVVRANYFAFGTPPGLFDADELSRGIHGGELETSLMLYLRPGLVRRDALEDFQGMTGHGVLLGAEKLLGIGWMSQDLHPEGVCGNAKRADAERGGLLLAYLADSMVRLVEETASLPLSRLRDMARPA